MTKTAIIRSEELSVPATKVDANEVAIQHGIGDAVGGSYQQWYDKVLPSRRRPFVQLVVFSIIFLGGFGVWATMAPIGGATVLDGHIVADGYNLKVNHKSGGIISEINVREGDAVEAGEVLAKIDSSEMKTNLSVQQVSFATSEIRLARYHAEEEDRSDFTLSLDLEAIVASNPSLQAVLESQKSELKARVLEKKSTLEIFDQRIASEKKTLEDLDKVMLERETRIQDLRTEISVSDDLLGKGYTTRDRNYNMKRQLSIDQEQLETMTTQTAERRSQHIQSQEERLRWIAKRSSEISGQIVALNAEKAEALERIAFYEDALRRSVIRAPQGGHIIRSYVNTLGSSVAAGEPIFEILPSKSSLLVEVMVSSRDIDSIQVGEKLDIRIPSQDRSRSLMYLDGEVTYVSYDAIPVGNPPRPMYVVRGRIDEESVSKYGGLKSGTNVSVFFLTEPKNFVHYILDPYIGIRDKAFTH